MLTLGVNVRRIPRTAQGTGAVGRVADGVPMRRVPGAQAISPMVDPSGTT